MPKISVKIVGSLLLSTASIVHSEVIEIISIADPRYQIENSGAGVLRPTQGMSMQQVEQQFGAPEEKLAAIGEPPIIRWYYSAFSVFFEHNLVIHSIVPR